MPRERGFTLLLLLLLLVVGAASVFVAAVDPGAASDARRPAEASTSLAQARELVIGRGLSDANRPGSIPCAAPDAGGSAVFNGNDCQVDAGRFPYRTLDSPPLRDAGGQLLWYVLDPALRDRTSQEPINPQAKPGALTVDGSGPYSAVVVAPGDALDGQDRAAGSRADFLEGGNEGGSDFTDCTGDPDCNDLVRGISTDRLFDPVQRRVLREVAEELVDAWEASSPTVAQRYLPYAADFGGSECEASREIGSVPTADADNDCGGVFVVEGDLPGWISDNGWLDLLVYRVDSACTAANRNCPAATLSVDGTGPWQAVIAGAGRALAGQSRPGAGVDDYLDAAENRDTDSAYTDRALSPSDNDALRGVSVP